MEMIGPTHRPKVAGLEVGLGQCKRGLAQQIAHQRLVLDNLLQHLAESVVEVGGGGFAV